MENNIITSATGWQLFRHDSWIWDIDAVESHSSPDCSGSRINVEHAECDDSGHAHEHDEIEDDGHFVPENAFVDGSGFWGGHWDNAGGSLHLEIEFPTPKTVQCIRVRQRKERPIVIRAKETPNSEWKNIKHFDNVAQTATLQIGDQVDFSEPECDVDSTMMVFSGHDTVESVKKGTIDVTWSPAFVHYMDENDESKDKFVDCGNYNFNVIVAKAPKAANGEDQKR